MTDNILDNTEKQQPIIDFYEESTLVHHRMWRLLDPAQCPIISRTMEHLEIYIADGHHRYQAMLNIRDEMRQKFPDAGPDAPWEFIMMFLVNSEHEGLTVLPTHRTLYNFRTQDNEDLGAQENRHIT